MTFRNVFDLDQPAKDINATRQDAPRFLSRVATPEQRTRHYIETRWHDQYQYYTRRAHENRKRHLQLQIFIAVVAVLVPVLLGFNANIINWVTSLSQNEGTWYSVVLHGENITGWVTFLNAVPAILSGLVAAATALENVQNYGTNWRAFQSAADGLERERALFEANSGPYRKSSNAYRLFVERAEDVIAQETGRFFAREEAAGEDDPEYAPEDVYNDLMTNGTSEADSPLLYDDADIETDLRARSYG
jgi:hypothetical protein